MDTSFDNIGGTLVAVKQPTHCLYEWVFEKPEGGTWTYQRILNSTWEELSDSVKAYYIQDMKDNFGQGVEIRGDSRGRE